MLKRSFSSLMVLGILTTACTSTTLLAANDATVAKQNTAVVLKFLDGVFNKHQVKESFENYVSPPYTQHQPKVGDGIEAGIKGLTWLTTTKYPSLRIEVKRSAAQGDLVFVHLKQIRDEADRNSGLGLAVVDIFRLEKGRIVEHWDVVEDVADPATAANKNGIF